jgi:hypothetical protein
LIRRGADSNSRPQYLCALEEWQTGHFVQKAFECAKYIDGYGNTRGWIDRCIEDEDDDLVVDRLSSWATDRYFRLPFFRAEEHWLIAFTSSFVQSLPESEDDKEDDEDEDDEDDPADQ